MLYTVQYLGVFCDWTKLLFCGKLKETTKIIPAWKNQYISDR